MVRLRPKDNMLCSRYVVARKGLELKLPNSHFSTLLLIMHVPVNSFIDPIQVLVLLNLVNQFKDSFILTFTES